MSNSRLQVALLVNKIASRQAALVEGLPALIAGAKQALDLTHETDELAESLTDLTGGTLDEYNESLQAVTEADLVDTLDALQSALAQARKFTAAAKKVKAEKLLAYWDFSEGAEDDESAGE